MFGKNFTLPTSPFSCIVLRFGFLLLCWHIQLANSTQCQLLQYWVNLLSCIVRAAESTDPCCVLGCRFGSTCRIIISCGFISWRDVTENTSSQCSWTWLIRVVLSPISSLSTPHCGTSPGQCLQLCALLFSAYLVVSRMFTPGSIRAHSHRTR